MELKSSGKNIFGELREYVFQAINAEQGLKIFHGKNFAAIYIASHEIVEYLKSDEIDEMGALALINMFSSNVEFQDFVEIRNILLGSEYEFLSYDPTEQYIAVAHAVKLNFPKYESFFLKALGEESQDADQSEPEKEPNE